MKKSAKVKNPCKICSGAVTNKNGVQCKGVCEKWAHFTCLNYTPGRILDIKAGYITVTCPCPDCNVQKDKKDFSTDSTGTGSMKPKCGTEECSVNKRAPIPPELRSRGVPSNNSCDPECPGITKPCESDCTSAKSIKLEKDILASPPKPLSCDIQDCPSNKMVKEEKIQVNIKPTNPLPAELKSCEVSTKSSCDPECPGVIETSCKPDFTNEKSPPSSRALEDKNEIVTKFPPCDIQDCPANNKPSMSQVNKKPGISVSFESRSHGVSPKSSRSPGTPTSCELGSGSGGRSESPSPTPVCFEECSNKTSTRPCSASINTSKDHCLPPCMIKKSASCSYLKTGETKKLEYTNKDTKTTQKSGEIKVTRSDSKLNAPSTKASEEVLLCTIHELCSAVGHLSGQIKKLMSKMMETLEKSGSRL